MRKLAGLVFLVLLGLYFVGIANGTKPGDSSVGATIVPPELLAASRARDRFHIVKTAWQRAGFGIVATADFTFANDNSVPIKDVTVSCRFYGASGTRLGDAEQTIYRTFPAQKSTAVAAVNLGFINSQSATASCDVANVVPIGDPTFDEFHTTQPPTAAPPSAKPKVRPAALPAQPR